jgi:hypothetical protein
MANKLPQILLFLFCFAATGKVLAGNCESIGDILLRKSVDTSGGMCLSSDTILTNNRAKVLSYSVGSQNLVDSKLGTKVVDASLAPSAMIVIFIPAFALVLFSRFRKSTK